MSAIMSDFANTLERGFCDSVSRWAGGKARVAPKVRAFDDTPAAHRFVISKYVRVKLTIQKSGSAIPVDAAAR
jgi:hypothetical protein